MIYLSINLGRPARGFIKNGTQSRVSLQSHQSCETSRPKIKDYDFGSRWAEYNPRVTRGEGGPNEPLRKVAL